MEGGHDHEITFDDPTCTKHLWKLLRGKIPRLVSVISILVIR